MSLRNPLFDPIKVWWWRRKPAPEEMARAGGARTGFVFFPSFSWLADLRS